MPLRDGLLIACKDGVIELTATVVDADRDPADALAAAVADRVQTDRHLAMTDPAILEDAEGLGLATVLESRDPLPESLQGPLGALGFEEEATEAGGRAAGGLLALVGRGKRTRLDRWRYRHRRAAEVDPRLGRFEDALVHAVDDPETGDPDAGPAVLEDAAAAVYGLDLSPSEASLVALERALSFEARHRLVLHPSAVRALTDFLTACVLRAHPGATFDPRREPPVILPSEEGQAPVGTDPQFRVVEWVAKGARSAPSQYLRALAR